MDKQLVLGILLGLLALPLFALLVRLFRIEIEDGEAVLVTRFGRLAAQLTRPGWHWLPDRFMPWVQSTRVSLKHDFAHIKDIFVNEKSGTTVVVDVWLELRIVDPEKATFAITDWNRALKNLVSHSVISMLGSCEFKQILSDRTQLGELVRQDIRTETARWGIEIEHVFLKNVSLLPEVSQRIFSAIAAQLCLAKADLEEHGRQRIALLRAQTSARIAGLIAEARSQYPLAVGRAYAKLKQRPNVYQAYQELYSLSLVRPQATVAFVGFEKNDLKPIDAAMLNPVQLSASGPG